MIPHYTTEPTVKPQHASDPDEFAEVIARTPLPDSRECCDLSQDSGRWKAAFRWRWLLYDACFFGGLLLALVFVLVVLPRLVK